MSLFFLLGTMTAAHASMPVIERHCYQCHGPKVERPKGKYVINIKDLKQVVPGKPDESRLFQVIKSGEMPPDKPLSPAEQAEVRRWIEEMAKPVPTMPMPMPHDPTPPEIKIEADEKSKPWLSRWIKMIGKFHILILHLPIGLIFGALLGELWSMVSRSEVAGVRFCAALGSITAVLTSLLGWFHAMQVGGELLEAHRWFGTAAMVTSLSLLYTSTRSGKWFFRASLFATSALIGLAGHYGGMLVHGKDFLSW